MLFFFFLLFKEEETQTNTEVLVAVFFDVTKYMTCCGKQGYLLIWIISSIKSGNSCIHCLCLKFIINLMHNKTVHLTGFLPMSCPCKQCKIKLEGKAIIKCKCKTYSTNGLDRNLNDTMRHLFNKVKTMLERRRLGRN